MLILNRGDTMEIKTYPIQFTKERLDIIASVAKKQGKSIKRFILDAIDRELKEDELMNEECDDKTYG